MQSASMGDPLQREELRSGRLPSAQAVTGRVCRNARSSRRLGISLSLVSFCRSLEATYTRSGRALPQARPYGFGATRPALARALRLRRALEAAQDGLELRPAEKNKADRDHRADQKNLVGGRGHDTLRR